MHSMPDDLRHLIDSMTKSDNETERDQVDRMIDAAAALLSRVVETVSHFPGWTIDDRKHIDRRMVEEIGGPVEGFKHGAVFPQHARDLIDDDWMSSSATAEVIGVDEDGREVYGRVTDS